MEADIYVNQVDIGRYWPRNAGVTAEQALADVRAGKARFEDYAFLDPHQAAALQVVVDGEKFLPSVPMATVPQPVTPGMVPLNNPDQNSPVIVTGNNEHTVNVLTSIWAQGRTPAYLVMVDCRGSTVDMAVLFGDFTPERLKAALASYRLEEVVTHRRLIVPGLTAALAREFSEATGWEIEIGPVCALELPLFLGDRWLPA